uniref:Uncharacterized protein n=1 Tax=Bactrocera dorsalis TaxID=27457 RepID=A0A034UXQ8_BACDO
MSPCPIYLYLMTGILLLASSILRISGKPFEGDASAEQLFSKTNDGKLSAEGNNHTVKHVINNYRGNGDSTQAENSMRRKNIEIMTKQFFDDSYSSSIESLSVSSGESSMESISPFSSDISRRPEFNEGFVSHEWSK